MQSKYSKHDCSSSFDPPAYFMCLKRPRNSSSVILPSPSVSSLAISLSSFSLLMLPPPSLLSSLASIDPELSLSIACVNLVSCLFFFKLIKIHPTLNASSALSTSFLGPEWEVDCFPIIANPLSFNSLTAPDFFACSINSSLLM